ncbi:MAG: hypothetical protein ACD_4C00156G0002 [uncultured bacterium (gcode 4)]|uniref:Alpha/beta hydrolase n=1 Tax=uncultured bacterium (gcode 4) TaxID=1234023 RepID=K2GTT6_9BACT|nr:MAG: hypothetical protein ACD_4C00156G0002 [uncultured bacterium (gcode 4)]
MKKVYIIPWYKTKKDDVWYQLISDFFESKWINAVIVDIKWEKQIMSQYVEQFIKQITDFKDEIYILGFSFWAFIAFLSNRILNPRMQFLCSLSPFFKNDLKHLKKPWLRFYWKRRMDDFKTFSFDELVKNIDSKTFILAWDNEYFSLIKRSKIANKKIKNSELHILEWVDHNLNDIRYLQTLEKLIKTL